MLLREAHDVRLSVTFPGFLETEPPISLGRLRSRERAPTRQLLMGARLVVIEAQSVQLSRTLSVVDAVRQRHADIAGRFSERYGAGLRYLIGRRCPDHAPEYYAAVMGTCIAAMASGEVASDDEIPGLLRSTYQAVCARYPRRVEELLQDQRDEAVVSEWRENLCLLAPLEREALWRFYVKREKPSAICEALGLSSQQFHFIRQFLRIADHPDVPLEPATLGFVEDQRSANA